MYTSDIDRRLYSTGVKYLIAAAAAAAAGAVYELFSHGVYSYYMIYAFMVPLVGGAFPCLIAAAKGGKKRRAHDAEATISAKLQLAAVATLTAGSFMKGVLEIYGTTNKLTAAYIAVGLALTVSALISFAAVSSKSSEGKRRYDADQYAGCDAAEEQNRKIKEYTQVLDQGGCH